MSRSTDGIAGLFRDVALSHPDRAAIIAPDITISYSKLWRIARGFAVKMHRHGIDETAMVAVHSTDMIATLATMLAASQLNARLVAYEARLRSDAVILPTHFLCSPEVANRGGESMIIMDASWPQAAPETEAAPVHGQALDIDAPWWVLHTSGTTGKPKYMMISQRCVVDRSMAVSRDFVPGRTVMTSLFSCHTRPFMVRATAALLHGCTIVDTIDPQFMATHGVNLVCGSPRNAAEWLAERTITPKLEKLQVSGARLSDDATLTFLKSFECVEDVYGSSETNKSFVNLKRLDDSTLTTQGVPQDSVVEIVDDAGAPCAIGEEGAIRVKNHYMAPGYIDEPEATERCFVEGWFVPGDRAKWGANGALIVTGRADNLMNIGGGKVDPSRMEGALRNVPGVSDAIVFRDPVQTEVPGVLAMITLRGIPDERDAVVAAAHQTCLTEFGPQLAPRMVYVVASLPMTHDGVPSRSEAELLVRKLPRPFAQTNTGIEPRKPI